MFKGSGSVIHTSFPRHVETFRHALCQGIADHHFPDPNDVLMSTRHERVDFPQSGYGKSIFLLFKFEFLQSDNIP